MHSYYLLQTNTIFTNSVVPILGYKNGCGWNLLL